MIIDTHCHLDDARYNEDIEEVLTRAKESGVERFIIPGADPTTLQRAVELAEQYDEIYFALGVHPYDAKNYNKETLMPFAKHPKCVAIGECGLDYYRLPEDEVEISKEKQLQKEVFVDQILLAKSLQLPLIVHIRESSEDCLALLEEYTGKEGGVLHCYNANERLLSLSDRGFYFGIGGVLTFKNAKKLINVYPKIPIERLIIETDAPYLTPHPHRGKRNEPSYTRLILAKMSELSEIKEDDLEIIITQNTQKLFPKIE
jgi:TatD DNase family protein